MAGLRPPSSDPGDAPDLLWLPPAGRQGRREEDEDEEARDEKHRDGPRQDGGPAAVVGFHGLQTPAPPNVLRVLGANFRVSNDRYLRPIPGRGPWRRRHR